LQSFVYSTGITLPILGGELMIQCRYCRNLLHTNNHVHSHIELHYNAAGRRRFVLNFGEQVELLPGQWLLVGKDVYHEETPDPGCSGFCLGLELSRLTEGSSLAVLEALRWHKSENDPTVTALLNQLGQEIFHRPAGYAESCQHLFALLIIHLLRSVQVPVSDISCRQKHPISVIDIIDDYCNQIFHNDRVKLTIENLAAKLYVTPRHVNRLLNKHYGMSFEQKLLTARMKYTEYLLRHTDYPIAEISEHCDMSESYLIRSFRAAYGITPAQYRKLNGKDTN